MQDNRLFNAKLVQNCPVCNSDYLDNRLEVIDENERGFLAYVSCGFCGSNIIVRVATMPHGLIGNAILTDLAPVEVLAYARDGEIESNSVLEMHRFISHEHNFIEKLRKS